MGIRFRLAVLALLLVGRAFPVSSQEQYTQEELRSLPRVCLAQTFISHALRPPVVSEQEQAQWVSRLGADYKHFHHYCWALIDLRRASRSVEPVERNGNYRRAVSNFEYVQRNVASTFPLLPEVCLRKGLALRYLGESSNAAREFLEAIKLKADYTPAYSALVDLYVDLQDYAGATDVLETGLAAAPGSKILESKKAELESLIASKR